MSVAIKSNVTPSFSKSMSMFSNFHAGSTTSTIAPFESTPVFGFPSVSSTSIVIVVPSFLFPDKSWNLSAGIPIETIPL